VFTKHLRSCKSFSNSLVLHIYLYLNYIVAFALILFTNEELARQVQVKEGKLHLRELENNELHNLVQNLSKEYQHLHDLNIVCQNEYHANKNLELFFEMHINQELHIRIDNLEGEIERLSRDKNIATQDAKHLHNTCAEFQVFLIIIFFLLIY
jgi:hypothetical protein